MEIDYEGARKLGIAIVYRAVLDYRINLSIIRNNPANESAKSRLCRIEKFFGSDICELYTGMDANYIVEKIMKYKDKMLEVKDDQSGDF